VAGCRTCQNPQVERVNALIASGTPIRQLARMTAIPRTSLARHAQHVPPADRPLGLVPAPPEDLGRVDPLAAAFELAERAHTERERLKSLEAIRAATALVLRQASGETDEEGLALLEQNISEAELAWRDGSSSFDHAVRALQGLREAIRQRLDAVRAPEGVPMHYRVVFTDEAGKPSESGGPLRGEPATFLMPLADYFRGTPKRFHDVDRFTVERTTYLSWIGSTGSEELKVRENETGALVWAKGRADDA
jgi:hypothetical protein